MEDEQNDEVSVAVVGIISTTATSAIAGILNMVNKTPDPNDDIIVYVVCLLIAAVITGCYYLVRNFKFGYSEQIHEISVTQRSILNSVNNLKQDVTKVSDDIMVLTDAVVTQERSDLIHRATKYIADRATDNSSGWITLEEKNAWLSDYKKYNALTEMYKIDNHYLMRLRDQIEDLPIRSI